jgi:GNAT superfamily N-acetyltransferase
MAMLKVDQLSSRDESAAVASLAAAFAEYPLFPPLCPDSARRPRFIDDFCRMLFRVSVWTRGVYATPDRNAVTCVFPPGKEWPSEWKYVRAGVLPMLWRLGWRNGWWFSKLGPAFDTRRALHMGTRPHWYVHLLGVRPEAQGKGLSRAVMRPVFEAADRQGTSIYLETTPEANVAVYLKLGFKLLGRSDLPGNLPNWELCRDPR